MEYNDKDTLSALPEFVALRNGERICGFTPGSLSALGRCEELCFDLNNTRPGDHKRRSDLVREIFAGIGDGFTVHSPLHCDLGFNVHIGRNFVSNYNLVILDEAEVNIGDNVFIGPNTSLLTIVHDLEHETRNIGMMHARPINIGDNVWIAADVTILPGVTVGEGAVIGAGSVVTRDIEPYTLVAGVPAQFIRKIHDSR